MPLYSIDKIDDKGFLAIWEVTENEEELREISSIPEEENEIIINSPNPRRRMEQLAVRSLLNICFDKKQYLGYEENNRPFIKNYSGDISISHAGRFVCILIHESKNVGVDLESAKRDFTPVENKILSPYEVTYIEGKHRVRQLCLIWSGKEAIYKAMHQQRVDFNNQMEIKKFIPKDEGKLSASFWGEGCPKQDLTIHYRFIEEFALTWVIR